MGATYKENFMEEVEQLGERRDRRPPARYVDECHIITNLTADNITEPSNFREASTGKKSTSVGMCDGVRTILGT